MLDVTTTAWAVTVGLILLLLAVDLAFSIARPHHVGFREATLASIFYVAVAIAFGVVFGSIAGGISAGSTSPATSSKKACRSTTSSSSW